MRKSVEKTTLAKIKKLAVIAGGLKSGEDYPITRLTTLKSLCADEKAAARFATHLARLAGAEAAKLARAPQMTVAAWRERKRLVAEAVTKLDSYVKRPIKSKKMALYDVLAEVKDINGEYRPYRWGQVRIIENRPALVVENGLRCVLSWAPEERGFWAYRAARDYAEKYDPRYGTGLMPKSAPKMEEIARFWADYYKVEV